MKRKFLSVLSLCLVGTLLVSIPVLADTKTREVTVNVGSSKPSSEKSSVETTKVEVPKTKTEKNAEEQKEDKKDKETKETKETKTVKKSETKEEKKKEVKEYTVTFKYGTKQKEFKVKEGESVDPPTDTFVPGFVFVSWTGEAKNVKSNMVILGGYRPTLGEIKDPIKTIPYVDSVVTTYTTSGRKYNANKSAGWPVSWQTKLPDLIEGEEGKTCCLHWYNGLTGDIWKTDVVEYGTSLAAPIADPYIDGYEFLGWEGSWVNVAEDRTIAAQFAKIYKVTFVDTVTNYPFDQKTVHYGDTVDLPAAPTHDGYNFCYYSGNGDNIHGDTTLYAVYERIPQEYYYYDNDAPWY